MSADEFIAVCSECNSQNSESYIEKNMFYKAGKPVPCQFCAGVVIITKRKDRDRAIDQSNRQRGLK